MITTEQVANIVDNKLVGSSNYLVEVKISSGNRITVLLDDDNSISINDCISMSKYIEENLDREVEDFELSVMSAGLGEPLKVYRQFIKNIGKQVEVLTIENKKIIGILLAVNLEVIEIESKTKEKASKKKGKHIVTNKIKINHNQIKQTKVVISF